MKTLILGALLASLGIGAAVAQGTLGGLLDAGAEKMSKQEVLDTVIGAMISGPTPSGGNVEITYKADGTYSGSYQGWAGARGAGKEGGIFGKWTLQENGKLCEEGRGGADKEIARCMYFYRIGDQLYEINGPALNRSAVALKRTAKR
jgi:hypothetical protein